LLRIAHLYADEMNIYGDRGNMLTLTKRAEWRGIEVRVEVVGRGPLRDLAAFDLIFWGGGQDRDQELVFNDWFFENASTASEPLVLVQRLVHLDIHVL